MTSNWLRRPPGGSRKLVQSADPASLFPRSRGQCRISGRRTKEILIALRGATSFRRGTFSLSGRPPPAVRGTGSSRSPVSPNARRQASRDCRAGSASIWSRRCEGWQRRRGRRDQSAFDHVLPWSAAAGTFQPRGGADGALSIHSPLSTWEWEMDRIVFAADGGVS